MIIFSMMTTTLKTIVSKKKKRYQANGFNLDLSYILPNLIAMGFPAERLEGVFRNNMEDVVKFMELKHKDHYKIYNLCSEREYDHSKFHNRVARFPIDDHNPPPFKTITEFCNDVCSWLASDSHNVAAIHCKAGKGRTGVMVCAYIIHSEHRLDADSALNFYAEKRTHNKKGVTIPSQRRYVHYYERLVKSGSDYEETPLCLKSIKIDPMPVCLKSNHLALSVVIFEGRQIIFKDCLAWKKQETGILGEFQPCLRLNGDIKVEFYHGKVGNNKVKGDRLFVFWFNTFFAKLESNEGVGGLLKGISNNIAPTLIPIATTTPAATSNPVPTTTTPISTTITTNSSNLAVTTKATVATTTSNNINTITTTNTKTLVKFRGILSSSSPSTPLPSILIKTENNSTNSPKDPCKSSSASTHNASGTMCISSPSSNLTSNSSNCITLNKMNGVSFSPTINSNNSIANGRSSVYHSSTATTPSSLLNSFSKFNDPRRSSFSGSTTNETSSLHERGLMPREEYVMVLRKKELDSLKGSLKDKDIDFEVSLTFCEHLKDFVGRR